MKPILDIGIAFHGQWDFLLQTIESIQKNTTHPYNLIIVEDGITSSNGARDKMKEMFIRRDPDTGEKIGDENVIYKWFQNNHGVAWAWNEILGAYQCDYLCIMNSDVWCFPEWDVPLIEALTNHSEASCVGPCTNYAANRQRVFPLAYPLEEAEKIWNVKKQQLIQMIGKGSNLVHVVQTIGFCFMMRSDAQEKIGWFDERFCPAFAEETDFCHRANRMGYKNYWVLDSYVHHFGSKTVGDKGAPAVREHLRKSLQVLKDKSLGKIKGEICHLEKKKKLN